MEIHASCMMARHANTNILGVELQGYARALPGLVAGSDTAATNLPVTDHGLISRRASSPMGWRSAQIVRQVLDGATDAVMAHLLLQSDD
jgi:hypothetical protein